MDDDRTPNRDPGDGELERLRRENALLRLRLLRVESELATTAPLVDQVKHLGLWDFTPYGIVPDGSWLAVDRAKATALMGALAHVDHWNPWRTAIEPRPQP
ncbi:MAG TPA: hypothetical protein VGL47_10110 [Amycolatopsis sp.]|uniref:Uncharacterized protein n=1 Tax=Amycolatopsis nalaikhensis TaxID=715472 RepID=A0ABY8XLA3_9PSEU|nr:hypothetical protein [Amycolatopsis sp. 2-2]WIV56399.1 hypothetical protein QP939_47690 [Amycolatopsis sp. 2-2]